MRKLLLLLICSCWFSWCANADNSINVDDPMDMQFDNARQALSNSTNQQLTIEQAEQQKININNSTIDNSSATDQATILQDLNTNQANQLNNLTSTEPNTDISHSQTKPVTKYKIGRDTPQYEQGKAGSADLIASLCEKNPQQCAKDMQQLHKYK
ncbi:MAG: hypothetical protein RLZZ293_552 [Pseudomonadota bacterium]|jgi:hypothetical protein